VIWRELMITRDQKPSRPLITSMSDLAASGGYYISVPGQAIVAQPGTLTGSIGIFAGKMVLNGTLDKVGVTTETVKSGKNSDIYSPFARFSPDQRTKVGQYMDGFYKNFVAKVAEGRHLTPERVDAVAQGRVWTGAQAKERGLVDTVGMYSDAIRSAAKRANLGDKPRVVYIEREPGKFAQLVAMLNTQIAAAVGAEIDARVAGALGVAPAALRSATRELGWVSDIVEHRKPFAAVVHCLCGDPN